MMNSKLLASGLIIFACIASYLQGLFGGFLFDDYHNIVENAAIQVVGSDLNSWIAAAVSSSAGMLRRPISMLSFALNDYYFGMSPIAFKSVNLLIHLSIGGLIYSLLRRLLPRLIPSTEAVWSQRRVDVVSIVIAGIWLLHPLNVSSVLYVVQRMNQLSTLFTLIGVIAYTVGRLRSLEGRPGMLVALLISVLSGALALFSKENGALIFLYIFVVEWICFRFKGLSRHEKLAIGGYFTVLLIIPAIFVICTFIVDPDWLLGGYKTRDFTLSERLMTQPRILAHYLFWIIVPLPQFMGMYHDDIAISTGLLSPPTTVLIMTAIAAIALFALHQRTRQPAFAFAVFWFLAGHSMESSVIALEQVFEHRNYAPMIGIIAFITIYVARLIATKSTSTKVVITGAAIVALTTATTIRASNWGSPVKLALTSVKHHPESPRSQYDAGLMTFMEAMSEGDRQRAVADSERYFIAAMELSDSYIHPVVSLMLTQHRNTPVPKHLMTELLSRISAAKRIQPNSIFQLQEAITDGRVIATQEDMQAIFEASMDNKSLKSVARAQMLNNYGRYHFVVLKDHQAAVSLTLAAAEQSPTNPVYQINLAKLALALNEPDRAAHHISKAAKLDVAKINSHAIEKVSEQIAKARH
jgi:protein O-mannosyl-transferase